MPETTPLAYDATKLPKPPEGAPIEVSRSDEEPETLNDDVMINVVPNRPCGTIRVKLVYAGRSTPIPADVPWAE
jgi:hypothetical protein